MDKIMTYQGVVDKILLTVLVLFFGISCNRNIENQEQGKSVLNVDLPNLTSNNGINTTEIPIDSVSFEDLENLINESVEIAEPIPIEWIRKFTNLNDSLISSSTFLGWWTNQENLGIKLMYLENYDSNYVRKIFLTFNRSNIQLDEKIFSIRCIKCLPKELFADVRFLSNTKKTNIAVNYYDPIFVERMIAPSDMVVRRDELWRINSNGKFILVKRRT